MEDFIQDTHSFINTLKKMEQEVYLTQDTNSMKMKLFHPEQNSKMVGLYDEYCKLKQDIVGYWVQELVFSIVGMAGIGKTTLAKKVFEDLDIVELFECRAWVTVGRKFQPEEVTQTILAQLGVDANNMVIEGLMGKRYLIVLDDVWDMQLVKDYLERSFPNTGNKSRVLLTSRIHHVSNDSFSYHLINMRLLHKQESWRLLCDRIFGQNFCPHNLEEAGKMIAEKCDGLPLTIITVAKLLSKAEETTESLWIQVATEKRHQIFIDAYDKISKVLYPSYDNLHEDLKLCFLYMGVFPQNSEISKSKLINLWIVEKIIEKGSFQTLEIHGVECLQHLALHNVVMVYQRSTILLNDLTERIKTCGVHSSWWHFCYKEARKNNLFHVLESSRDAAGEVIKGQRRLTIHNNVLFGIKDVSNSIKENSASTVHSFLCLGPYHQYPVPIYFGLKLLKKLDALTIRFYEFPLEVLELVKIPYSHVQRKSPFFHIQTFKTSIPNCVSTFEYKIWSLVIYASRDMGDEKIEASSCHGQ